MKHVRTARGYQSLSVPHPEEGKDPFVVGRSAIKVSNEHADHIAEAAEGAGVLVRVLDAADDDAVAVAPVVQAQPDLSAGTSAISGTGDPVTSPDTDTTPDEGTNGRTARKAGK